MALRHRLADLLARAAGLHTLRCPAGCGVVIRYRHVSDTEAKRLANQAADHPRHQPHHA